MSGKLSEVRVLVAGGSGSIGKAIVRALLLEGAFVAMAARAGERLKEANHEMKKEGLDVFAVVMDVESHDSITEVVHLLHSRWGGVDAFFNCAGTGMEQFNPSFASSAKPFHTYEIASMRRAMDVNYIGYFAVTQAFMPTFIEQGRGKIVNVDVDRELLAIRGFAPFSPTRSATDTLTMIMAKELEGSGITANILTPGGFVKGGMFPPGTSEDAFGKLLDAGIMGPPAVFLASSDSDGLNGERVVASEFKQRR
ncbi:MAG: SDR family oxidoreductase [Thermoplasmata archaeon]|nr:SDR family oxidoreductase [Candidatus Sysuiplasma acidicola]